MRATRCTLKVLSEVPSFVPGCLIAADVSSIFHSLRLQTLPLNGPCLRVRIPVGEYEVGTMLRVLQIFDRSLKHNTANCVCHRNVIVQESISRTFSAWRRRTELTYPVEAVDKHLCFTSIEVFGGIHAESAAQKRLKLHKTLV